MYNTHQAGFYRPVSDFIPAVHSVSLDCFNRLGAQANRTQQATDLLSPFWKSQNCAIKKDGNIWKAEKPKDYQYYQAAGLIKDEEGKVCCDPEAECLSEELREDFYPATESNFQRFNATLVQGNKWNSVTTHATKGPSITSLPYRIYLKQLADAFEVLPGNVPVIVIDYYRLPKKPVFKYAERVSGPDIFLDFVETGSEHLEWSDAMMPVFLYRLGKYYGLTIRDELILQVATVEKTLVDD